MARNLRTIFGTEIKFEKLSKEDLGKLSTIMSDAPQLAAVSIRAAQSKFQKAAADRGPKIMQTLSTLGGNNGGFFGFGVLNKDKIVERFSATVPPQSESKGHSKAQQQP